MREWLKIAFRRDVCLRGLRVAGVVGTLLVIINQGDLLFHGQWSIRQGVKIVLTYFVPYGVSTYASVASIRKMEREGETC